MATDITNRFRNQDKRYSEVLAVTVPSVLQDGGGRTGAGPVYVQGGDVLTAKVIEEDTLVVKGYLNITEAFPAGATITVSVGGVEYFAAVVGTATGLTVATVEDEHFPVGGVVEITIGGITGDVLTGKVNVLLNVMHPSLKNGQYANNS